MENLDIKDLPYESGLVIGDDVFGTHVPAGGSTTQAVRTPASQFLNPPPPDTGVPIVSAGSVYDDGTSARKGLNYGLNFAVLSISAGSYNLLFGNGALGTSDNYIISVIPNSEGVTATVTKQTDAVTVRLWQSRTAQVRGDFSFIVLKASV